MQVSQKSQYALRAILDLSLAHGRGPRKCADVASAQSIPGRFLEVILNELKQAGFVSSRRGQSGGFTLARAPSEISVGEVLRFVEGPLGPVPCATGEVHDDCPHTGDCVFTPLWTQVHQAMSMIYDGTAFSDLVEDYKRREEYVPNYVI